MERDQHGKFVKKEGKEENKRNEENKERQTVLGSDSWATGKPIESYPCGIAGGHWYPAVEIYKNDFGDQKFIIHDDTEEGRYPVERVADSSIDLRDPVVLIDQWRTVKQEEEKEEEAEAEAGD